MIAIMKTIEYPAAATPMQGPAHPEVEASLPQHRSPEVATLFWFPAIPWLIPVIAASIVIATGLIWSVMLWT